MKRKTESQLCMEKMLDELFPAMWESEYKFALPEKKFRFDYAVRYKMLGIEIDGGIWTGGRHTRGAGFQRDLLKFNIAASRGWRVFRFSTADVLQRKPMEFLR